MSKTKNESINKAKIIGLKDEYEKLEKEVVQSKNDMFFDLKNPDWTDLRGQAAILTKIVKDLEELLK
jgi:hypothetical protein